MKIIEINWIFGQTPDLLDKYRLILLKLVRSDVIKKNMARVYRNLHCCIRLFIKKINAWGLDALSPTAASNLRKRAWAERIFEQASLISIFSAKVVEKCCNIYTLHCFIIVIIAWITIILMYRIAPIANYNSQTIGNNIIVEC